MEPNKCEGWQFITWPQLQAYAEQDFQGTDEAQKMLFKPMVHFVQQHGFDPYRKLQEIAAQD